MLSFFDGGIKMGLAFAIICGIIFFISANLAIAMTLLYFFEDEE